MEEAKKYKSAEEFIDSLPVGGKPGRELGRGEAFYISINKPSLNKLSSEELSKIGFKNGKLPEKITIYRGVPRGGKLNLVSGDYVATNRNTAAAYGGEVQKLEVRPEDLVIGRGNNVLVYRGKPEETINKLTDIYNQAQKETKPKEVAQEKTPSKIAKSIQQKAIEQKLTKGFADIAGYDKITIEDQARKASELISDIEKARRVIRGEEQLPTGLRGTALITAAEEYIKQTGNKELAYELANSPLVSETSTAAQELRLAAEREPDSLAQKLTELRKAKEEAIKKRTGKKVKEAVKDEVTKIKKQVKKVDKYDWNNFVKSIEC